MAQLYSYQGQEYSLPDGLSNEEDINNCAKNEADQTLMAAETIQKAGINCELVTVGSTPTTLSGCKNIGIFLTFMKPSTFCKILTRQDIYSGSLPA